MPRKTPKETNLTGIPRWSGKLSQLEWSPRADYLPSSYRQIPISISGGDKGFPQTSHSQKQQIGEGSQCRRQSSIKTKSLQGPTRRRRREVRCPRKKKKKGSITFGESDQSRESSRGH